MKVFGVCVCGMLSVLSLLWGESEKGVNVSQIEILSTRGNDLQGFTQDFLLGGASIIHGWRGWMWEGICPFLYKVWEPKH